MIMTDFPEGQQRQIANTWLILLVMNNRPLVINNQWLLIETLASYQQRSSDDQTSAVPIEMVIGNTNQWLSLIAMVCMVELFDSPLTAAKHDQFWHW